MDEPPSSDTIAVQHESADSRSVVLRKGGADDFDFLAACKGVAELSLPVIHLPGKGRTRTGPLMHWPRRSIRNAALGSQRTRQRWNAKTEEDAGRQKFCALTPSLSRRPVKRFYLRGPVSTPHLDAAVAEAQAERAAKIRNVQGITASLTTLTRKRVRFVPMQPRTLSPPRSPTEVPQLSFGRKTADDTCLP